MGEVISITKWQDSFRALSQEERGIFAMRLTTKLWEEKKEPSEFILSVYQTLQRRGFDIAIVRGIAPKGHVTITITFRDAVGGSCFFSSAILETIEKRGF